MKRKTITHAARLLCVLALAMSMTTALLWERFRAGGAPIAVVSMDNCSHNGEKLRTGVMAVVEQWLDRGHVTPEFAVWVANENKVSFPWSMIDKITTYDEYLESDEMARKTYRLYE